MSPRTIRLAVVRSPAMSRRISAVMGLALAAILAACTGAAPSSFDPTGPCSGDGSSPGAYPDLEALVPVTFEDRAPDRLDSGRNCSNENLGSLADEGIEEVRFAGGTWEFGSDIAVVLAVFAADGLTSKAMARWWETTARDSARTQIVRTTEVDMDGLDVRRLDTKTGERLQSVLVWPGDEPDQVNVVLTHNMPDPKIEAAVAAFGD